MNVLVKVIDNECVTECAVVAVVLSAALLLQLVVVVLHIYMMTQFHINKYELSVRHHIDI